MIVALVIIQLTWLLISLQVTKSNTNPDDLGGLANQLTNEFGNLADEAKYAAITAENDEVNKFNLISACRHFGIHFTRHASSTCLCLSLSF